MRDYEHISDDMWRRLSRKSRLAIWIMVELYSFQNQLQFRIPRFTRRLRLLLVNFPPGLAVIHAVTSFVMLAIAPRGAPPVWMAINYVLSFYIACWLWLALNRRFRPGAVIYG